MIQLKAEDMRQAAKPLLNESSPTFAHAIADGIIDGKMYADHSVSPRSAVFQTPSGIYHLAGSPPESKRDEWHYYLKEQRNGRRFTVFSDSAEWDAFLTDGLDNTIKQMKRIVFSFVKEPEHFVKDAGAACVMFSEEDLNESVLFNEQYADEYWGGADNFLKKGFGFKAVCGNRTVSECVSIFRSDRFAEIDIATDPDFRGRGYAALCARAFISYCKEHRMKPRWDCDQQNTASIRLAEKLGFRPLKNYSLYVQNR
ncbi:MULTISPECIES: GNAT family N-acetyltransferase [Bacillus]|uniref:GNAT family N-acetyltransferase n=1 Tax=Bacillus glycinifermentans TaxID=1664069 RepID=A0AAJ4D3P0_9BACI|nr:MULTISPECIES: GNAT family N-acetyltransferase [Bacillus]KKB72827.1 rhodopsin [Bacillus sp. TH008]MDU0073272.1 GNAT family N-acetyltransferase [Bacillus sp. IG6]MED8021072.1 GNAT family N-acetyltransferase [Bacillus glycinifermentans]QAT66132.1 GNAT family N-acetyltransferase [Bacillus glycinifermentans]WKB75840.1 GNAT family N-acetyltransferase [Bacillus glycinifermentans]